MKIDIPIKYERAISAIQDLYEVHGAGGYGHIVFDDCNYDCVSGCLHDAIKSTYIGLYDDAEDHELTRTLSIKALELCKDFTEDEVEFCVVMYRALNHRLVFATKP